MLTQKTPKDLVEQIDDEFKRARQARISRFDIKWGTWSRKMNLYIRKKIEEGDAEGFKYVMAYWAVTSQLLELHFRTKFKEGKKRKLENERRYIKKCIHGKGKIELSMDDIAKMVLGNK